MSTPPVSLGDCIAELAEHLEQLRAADYPSVPVPEVLDA